ncbi:branched-chain amino acid ABC transporter permease [Aeromicrobium wangtongii]|uniref:branched-chain amino acid ABC transporter permease n=1 Tax=Aeromicrobium wangtongii TaxID=2969247 RepID=UPI002017DB92|nr:branched-chain amino acid ABC transporter permease [Aeromicrobium wangtongii]MCL3819847.1 branched-chain amino acid ABC transporter permease [Aeromicrobium wangtongii]
MNALDRRFPFVTKLGIPVLAGFALVAVVMPMLFGGSQLFTWTTAAAWVLFATATSVIFGWTGLLSFGQAAFFGMGAYTMALLNESGADMSALLMLVIAAVAAGLVAALFAMFALRTSGAEFAILTLVLAQVLWLLTYRVAGLKGEDGFSGIYQIKIISAPLTSDLQLWHYTIAVVGICTWLLWLLSRSTAGRAMRAVRDDPFRAAALGISVRRVQVSAFAVSAAFSAVAGALIAQGQGVVSPGMLLFGISGEILVACLIGGTGRFVGPMIGAVVLIWSQTLMANIFHESSLFVGVLLLLIVIALPEGLVSLPGRIRGRRRRSHRGSPPRPPGEARTTVLSTESLEGEVVR